MGKVHERRLVTQSFLWSSSPPKTGPHTLRLRNCGADMLERVSVTRLSRWNLEGSSGYGLSTVIGNGFFNDASYKSCFHDSTCH